MPMPNNLILVRHGQSEGNAANQRSREGDHSDFTDEFKSRHSSQWQLTDKGIWQARKAGEWIEKEVGIYFDRYYVSEYYRAMQTAAYLGLKDAMWYGEFYLRERDMGVLDVLSQEERMSRHTDSLKLIARNKFFTRPPGGESMADLCLRVDRVLNTLHRECAGQNVVIVCHGEVMWAFRMRLEHMSMERYDELDKSEDVKDRINNCQILHYTRIDPESGRQAKFSNWFRSVSPTDLSLSRNEWEVVKRPTYSNDDLLARVDQSLRMVNEPFEE